MAHPKLETIRQRYHYRCGYCGVSETDSGGELTVDHFVPLSAGGENNDENLVYSCIRCNQYKAAYFPDPDAQAIGNYLLHPLRDDLTAHIQANPLTGSMQALTQTGTFHIALLQLNRPALIAHRRRENYQILARMVQETLQRQLNDLWEYTDSLEKQIALLKGKPPEED